MKTIPPAGVLIFVFPASGLWPRIDTWGSGDFCRKYRRGAQTHRESHCCMWPPKKSCAAAFDGSHYSEVRNWQGMVAAVGRTILTKDVDQSLVRRGRPTFPRSSYPRTEKTLGMSIRRTSGYIKRADRCGLAPVNSFVGLSGGDQVALPDHLMNCGSEVAVELAIINPTVVETS